MSANKLFFMTVVLLGMCALVAGCVSDTVSPTDEAPILPPENLTARPSAESVTLTWNANSHPMLAGYFVYRAQINTQETVKLTADPIKVTTYTDNTVMRGVAYEYRVTAVTKAGKESVCASIGACLRLSAHDPGVNEN
jgi:fibronectin type 3 domain-containing protein